MSRLPAAPEVMADNSAPLPPKAEVAELEAVSPRLARQQKKLADQPLPAANGLPGTMADSAALADQAAPVPVGGWVAYNAYLAKAPTGTDGAAKSNKADRERRDGRQETAAALPPAQVVLRLTIGADGAIGRVRIRQGLGKARNAEAVKRVRQGPGWLPARAQGQARQATVEVMVPFN
jgi:hypothetical protein